MDSASPVVSSVRQATGIWKAAVSDYSEELQPLGAYAVLLSVFGSFVAGLIGAAWLTKSKLPKGPKTQDIALLGIATHKLARLITKDLVTAPFRAPFVKFKESAGEGEVEEESRKGGMKEAVGDLLTCPYCIAVWLATPMWFGMMFAPRVTRFIAGILATVTVADFMQRAYLKAKESGD